MGEYKWRWCEAEDEDEPWDFEEEEGFNKRGYEFSMLKGR